VAFSETGHYDEIAQKILPSGVAFLDRRDAHRPLPPAFYSTTYFKRTPENLLHPHLTVSGAGDSRTADHRRFSSIGASRRLSFARR
jgi:hypothetical protein